MSKNKNVPEIRFPGFEDDWEQRKLKDIGSIVTGSTPSTSFPEYYSDDGIPWVTPTDIAENITFDTARKLSPSGQKVARIAPANTILVTCIASIGKNTMLGITGSFNQQINGLIPDESKYDAYFLLTESALWSDQMKRLAATGTMQIVNRTEFSELKTLVPKQKEQVQIGTFFRFLDNLITLHQRKFEETKKYKKAMLQKMFPQKGKYIPEIRFPGFTGDWEQHKVKDVAPLQRGFDLPTNKMELGNYPVVMSNGIGGYHSKFKVKGPGVVTGRSGTIGNLHYIECDYWPHNTALWVTDFKKNYPKFIYYLYQRLDLSRFGSGSGVPTLNRNDVHDAVISVPHLSEQQRIAEFMTSLDNLITLHQRKIESMKEYKKGLLQKMFV